MWCINKQIRSTHARLQSPYQDQMSEFEKNWHFMFQESNRRNDVPEIGGRTRRRQWSALRGRRLRRNNLPQNHRGLWSGNLSFDIVVGHPCIMKDLRKMCQEKGLYTECIMSLGIQLINEASRLLSGHFWPLLKWAAFLGMAEPLAKNDSSLIPNNHRDNLSFSKSVKCTV